MEDTIENLRNALQAAENRLTVACDLYNKAMSAWHEKKIEAEVVNRAANERRAAKSAITRIKKKIKIAETGVDDSALCRKKKYSARLPGGGIITRSSHREYTHAIIAPTEGGKWWVDGWAGSETLAAKRVLRLANLGYKAQAIPAEIS